VHKSTSGVALDVRARRRESSRHEHAPADDSSTPPSTIWKQLLRLTATCEALLAFGQSALAGGFLEGRANLLALHRANAILVWGIAMSMTIASVALWRLARGPLWPAGVSLALVATILLQMVLGYRGNLLIHVPLGVIIISADVLLAVWAWRSAGRP